MQTLKLDTVREQDADSVDRNDMNRHTLAGLEIIEAELLAAIANLKHGARPIDVARQLNQVERLVFAAKRDLVRQHHLPEL